MKSILTIFLLFATVAFAQFPWSGKAPQEIEQAALLPDCVLDESPSNWRPVLQKIFQPLVKDCKTAREAALTIAANMTQATGVYYSRERRHPLMNPLEALAEKKVSCTGQSILLVCALRSIGIPARAVGIGTWGHIRGNHTWCEVWCDGGWNMLEFNEKEFNTPWVMEYVGLINPQISFQRIYAVSPQSKDAFFPAVWNPWSHIAAEDVTERYLELSRRWYEKAGLPPHTQRILIDVLPRTDAPRLIILENEQGEELAQAPLPTAREDMRRSATLNLPRKGQFYLRIQGSKQRLPISPTPTPVQNIILDTAPDNKN